jgi:pimeloyl-ACP methyl ester carboxylesterase
MLAHSAGFSHREFEPLVEHLSDRFRLVLPDLPLHGDSEDRPHHSYSHEWLASVLAQFCTDTCGTRPLVGGHGLGAELLVQAVAREQLTPKRMVLMPNRLHDPRAAGGGWLTAARLGSVPGIDYVASHVAKLARRPDGGVNLTATGNEQARDLVRHAMADVGGNANLARSWSRFAARAGEYRSRDLLDQYSSIDVPVLLLWADNDQHYAVARAEEALDLLPDAQLRVVSRTGFLMSYDDPVEVSREIVAFCR